MKRNELERSERDFRKKLKKEARHVDRPDKKSPRLMGFFIQRLLDNFQYDDHDIYNIHEKNESLLELVMEIQEQVEDKEKIEALFRRAIKRTKVAEKEKALTQLSALLV